MKSKLTDNMLLKILSVVIALVLWLVVVNISDAKVSRDFTLEVNLLNTDVITGNGKVYRVEDNSNVVKVTVRARSSVIRTLSKNDFILTADMEKDLKYDSLVGITVECRNKNINVNSDVKLARSNVKVSIEDSATEQFPVTVKAQGEPASGYYVGSMVPEQTILKITGPMSIVNKIKRVEASVDVTGQTGSVVRNSKLKILDENGEELDSAYLEYYGKQSGIDVSVEMLNIKTIPLKVNYVGTPAENYRITEVSCKPDTIQLAGTKGALSTTNEILISDAINVDGITEEVRMVLDISEYLPAGLVLMDEDDATIVVTIQVEYVEPEAPQEDQKDQDDSEKDNKKEDSKEESKNDKGEEIKEESSNSSKEDHTSGEGDEGTDSADTSKDSGDFSQNSDKKNKKN